VATINAVHKHASLLRCGIGSASNDHRLGGNEAPPSIISVFLGQQLTEVLNSIEEGRETKKAFEPKRQSVKVGGAVLDVMVSTLPEIYRDTTDRNRTSPFAFTGNKFEFRAVGSKQSPSFPMTLLNATVASSIQEVIAALEAKSGGKTPSTTDIMTVVKQFITQSKAVRFEGDGYSAEWHAEALKRGLPNFKNAPEAFRSLKEAAHQKVLTENEIFSQDELDARYHVLTEHYAKDLLIEANTLKTIISTQILPVAYETRKSTAESVNALKNAGVSADPEKKYLEKLGASLVNLEAAYEKLAQAIVDVDKAHDDEDLKAAQLIIPALNQIREIVDGLEGLIPDNRWPFPKYNDLLFSI
jgi:glutamine synthetase